MFTKLNIFHVGKTSTDYKILQDHYLKLISSKIDLTLIEPDNHLPVQKQKILTSDSILNKCNLNNNEILISMDSSGKVLSSEKFAEFLQNISFNTKKINFAIGGSWGLSENLLSNSKFILSFSKMTFPHQLAKIMLLEQIYRAENIIFGGNYHK